MLGECYERVQESTCLYLEQFASKKTLRIRLSVCKAGHEQSQYKIKPLRGDYCMATTLVAILRCVTKSKAYQNVRTHSSHVIFINALLIYGFHVM